MTLENPVSDNAPAPDRGGESEQQPNTTKPQISTALGKPESQESKTHYEITCKKEKDWWDKVKPYVETAGVVLLAVYTGYTIKMYCANKRAADAAQTAAGAAKDAANTARDSLNIVQRAYISFKEVGGSRTGIVGDPKSINLTVTFTLENSGYTPTRGMTEHVSCTFLKHGIPPHYNFPDLWENRPLPHNIEHTVVGPKGIAVYQAGPIPFDYVSDNPASPESPVLLGVGQVS
jgi:hypothetical protein